MSTERSGPASVHVLPSLIPRGEAVSEATHRCDHCGTPFVLRYAFQQVSLRDQLRHVCSQDCREQLLSGAVVSSGPRSAPAGRPMVVAVLNQKGGTGKTTTAVNLAAGLSEAGRRVLLIDVDAQGHVGVSLGLKGEKTLYHILVEDAPLAESVVPFSPTLDLLTANETLASAEIFLARMDDGRDRLLRQRVGGLQPYDIVLLDCGPSLSLLNLNALTLADYLLVPVSCDFLSLVGVRQILKTVRHVNELLLHPIEILGVLPTFYDQRNRISDESVKSLRSHFKNKVLPPIRINTRLKEAPSHRKTIFEYAPHSRGAEDYRRLVRWVLQRADERSRVAVGSVP